MINSLKPYGIMNTIVNVGIHPLQWTKRERVVENRGNTSALVDKTIFLIHLTLEYNRIK